MMHYTPVFFIAILLCLVGFIYYLAKSEIEYKKKVISIVASTIFLVAITLVGAFSSIPNYNLPFKHAVKDNHFVITYAQTQQRNTTNDNVKLQWLVDADDKNSLLLLSNTIKSLDDELKNDEVEIEVYVVSLKNKKDLDNEAYLLGLADKKVTASEISEYIDNVDEGAYKSVKKLRGGKDAGDIQSNANDYAKKIKVAESPVPLGIHTGTLTLGSKKFNVVVVNPTHNVVTSENLQDEVIKLVKTEIAKTK